MAIGRNYSRLQLVWLIVHFPPLLNREGKLTIAARIMLNQVFPKILNTKNKPISLNNMKMQIRDWIFEMLPPIVSIPAKEKIAVVIMPANKVRKRHLLPDLYLGKAINQSNS